MNTIRYEINFNAQESHKKTECLTGIKDNIKALTKSLEYKRKRIKPEWIDLKKMLHSWQSSPKVCPSHQLTRHI